LATKSDEETSSCPGAVRMAGIKMRIKTISLKTSKREISLPPATLTAPVVIFAAFSCQGLIIYSSKQKWLSGTATTFSSYPILF